MIHCGIITERTCNYCYIADSSVKKEIFNSFSFLRLSDRLSFPRKRESYLSILSKNLKNPDCYKQSGW